MKNSQSVIDTADKSVDSSIALEVSTLSAFMFFAMIKQETVVGDPDIPIFRRSTRKLPTFTFFSSTDVAYYMPCYP